MTDSVNVERALTERNEALSDAASCATISSTTSPTSCARRSPTSSASASCSAKTVGPLNRQAARICRPHHAVLGALLAIINDILDLATIDTGAMELELGDGRHPRQTMQAAAEACRTGSPKPASASRSSRTDDIGSLRADGKRVRQVLFNLLSNAIGFSPPGQTVTLAAERRDEEIVFTVADQGRGIPPSVLDRVFDRFESTRVGTRHRGVGLGLSIVRSFVELHGGKVDSSPRRAAARSSPASSRSPPAARARSGRVALHEPHAASGASRVASDASWTSLADEAATGARRASSRRVRRRPAISSRCRAISAPARRRSRARLIRELAGDPRRSRCRARPSP